MSELKYRVNDISESGLNILVEEDEEWLTLIDVGELLEIYYCPYHKVDAQWAFVEIKHISVSHDPALQGFRMVGMYILKRY